MNISARLSNHTDLNWGDYHTWIGILTLIAESCPYIPQSHCCDRFYSAGLQRYPMHQAAHLGGGHGECDATLRELPLPPSLHCDAEPVPPHHHLPRKAAHRDSGKGYGPGCAFISGPDWV